MTKEFNVLKDIIKSRRAVKKGYTDKEVTEELISELLDIAVYAPTHGMREPWRFVFVHQDKLSKFAHEVGQTYPDELKQNREDYLNEPNAILVVLMEGPTEQKQWEENYGAVASLIQNFWLLASQKELGVVWKTNPHIYNEQVKEIVGAQENERIVGFIHLGYYDEEPIDKGRIEARNKLTSYE